MKALISQRPVLRGAFVLALAVHGALAQSPYDFSTVAPKFQTLSTTLNPTGGPVSIQINVFYDVLGRARATGVVDGVTLPATAVIPQIVANPSYSFVMRRATAPPITVTVSGGFSNRTALCSYLGPKGRITVRTNPVTIEATRPVPGQFALRPSVTAAGVISGTGQILSDYSSTNVPGAGKLTGRITTNMLTWSLKHGVRSLTFTGRRAGTNYVGKLTALVPPGNRIITNFSVPATDFPVTIGLATFRGTITIVTNQTPQPALGTVVTVRTDLNGDGKFAANEMVSGRVDNMGQYQLRLTIDRNRTVSMQMHKTGFADVNAVFAMVNPGAVVTRNASLRALQTLTVATNTATSPDGKLMLEGLPSNIREVEARVFNPITETAQFPGAFADDRGNLLVSTVFSAIEARDGAGRSVTNLGTNATLCMQVSRDCWPSLGDLTSGNGQIDVPMYFFDEDAGQWRRSASNGWLENAARQRFPEGALASITSQSYTGIVFAVGRITHLSYWNIDWPIETHGTLVGKVVDAAGRPVAGANVSAEGTTYTGSSASQVTGADGRFSVDVMRSENPGEDVDRDGAQGETQRVRFRILNGANYYGFGPYATPLASGASNALDLGCLSLDSSNQLALRLCMVAGQVVFSGVTNGGAPALMAGDGVPNAFVYAYDPDAIDAGGGCTGTNVCNFAIADSQGRFQLNAQLLSGLQFFTVQSAFSGQAFSSFAGRASVSDCPVRPLTLEADYTEFDYLMGTLNFTSGQGSGFFLVANGAATGQLIVGRGVYLARIVASARRPTALGPWLTFDLLTATVSGFNRVGTLVLSVTSLSPLSGTWRASGGVVASGTWTAAGTE